MVALNIQWGSIVATFKLGAVLLLITSPALGQTLSGQDCNTLANTIAAGYTTAFSDRDFAALRYYASCEATDSSSGGGLSIGYAAFSLGASYSQARNSQICKQSRDSVGIHDTEYNSAKVVFTQALGTIDRCLELAGQGWRVKYVPAGSDAVSLTLSHGGTNGGRLLGAETVPPDSLTCKPELPTQPINVTPTAPFSTLCYRSPKTQLVNGIEVKTTDDANIDLRLDDGPFVIPLKGYQSSIVRELQSQMTSQKADIDAQRNSLAALITSLSSKSGEAKTYTFDRPVRDPQEKKNYTYGECESGFYVSRVMLIFDNGGEAKETGTGISHMQITCRKLGLP